MDLHAVLEAAVTGEVAAALWNVPPPLIAPLPLFVVRFDAGGFDGRLFAVEDIACPGEIANAVRKRQAEFFYGRLCARAALGKLGIVQAIGRGLTREPQWPAQVVGSITHSRSLAAAVALPAARCRGAGLDIEDVADVPGAAALRASVVSERELAYLDSLSGCLDMHVLLTLVFSAKESFFKGCFAVVQRFFDFDALALDGIDLETKTISFEITQFLCPEWRPGARCQLGFALLAAGQVATVFVW